MSYFKGYLSIGEPEVIEPVYLFTSGSLHKIPEVKTTVDALFKKAFSTPEIGLGKEDSKAYTYIASDIGVVPQEVIFIDDKIANIEAARCSGFLAVQFISNEQLFGELSKLLKKTDIENTR